MDELNALSEDPDLWNDPDNAQKIMKERTGLETKINKVREFEQNLSDQTEMIELAQMEGDDDLVTEAEDALFAMQVKAEKLGLESLLSGEVDGYDAYLEVNAGAGGTESCDWSEMLLRMYMRWADKRGYKVSIMDRNDGDEAGIKSATIQVSGDNAYGWLKTESGVHRLVRISPFDSNARRHTSFSSVAVTPVIDESFEVDIDEKDIKLDTFRASGAGGQHVNTTDSAVRLTHIPTGTVVACQNERSQHSNRATAMNMLRARLYELELQKRMAEKQQLEDAKTDIGWGHQIRSYVLQPYQMIKDLRTQVETSNSNAVLDGDIDLFLEASLASQLAGAVETDQNS